MAEQKQCMYSKCKNKIVVYTHLHKYCFSKSVINKIRAAEEIIKLVRD